jgi:sugar O-acyltransferase (sialic acid O-acetyltransferase NeuD family)
MSKPSLILIGAGGHAHSCIDVIEHLGVFKIAGLIGTEEELQNECMGYRIIGTDSDLPELAKRYEHALITVGQIESARVRQRIYDQALALGFKFPCIISPRAYVSPYAVVGDGTIVMHGAIVNANAKVGNNCIINTKALIEHDATVADHCHISTGAIINGAASVGSGSFVGSGSVIKQGITLGSRCVVGMGISVRHHHAENSRILRSNKS